MMSLVPSLSTITTFCFLGRFLRFREGHFGCCYVPPSVNVPVDKEVSSVNQKDNEVKVCEDSLKVDDASKCVENLDAEVLNIDAYKEVAVECQYNCISDCYKPITGEMYDKKVKVEFYLPFGQKKRNFLFPLYGTLHHRLTNNLNHIILELHKMIPSLFGVK
ncbi:hypothetical protein QYF36_004412 [Acer negundo]|nr:hypothetical protein QYF36_004412 [Acer negundo]